MFKCSLTLASSAVMLAFASVAPAHAAVDAAAAEALFKDSKCTKCHAPDKTKTGPSLKSIAADLKGKADAQDKVVKQMTTGPKLKDGSAEHPKISAKDPKDMKNLADWILAQ
jgi:cytochrome c